MRLSSFDLKYASFFPGYCVTALTVSMYIFVRILLVGSSNKIVAVGIQPIGDQFARR